MSEAKRRWASQPFACRQCSCVLAPQESSGEISVNEEIARLQLVIDRWRHERGSIRVLEAGCGSASALDFGGDAYIVGIDISEKQLARNQSLDEKVCGDLQRYELPASAFDAIVCWDVLEHLPEPEKALRNFANAAREDGIIVLAAPNILSAKGLATKFTPMWFHIWAYKRFFDFHRAGTDDVGPFPTYLRPAMSPRAIKRFASKSGLSVEYFRLYEALRQKRLLQRHRVANVLWRGFRAGVKYATLGRLDLALSDYIAVLRKPGGDPSQGRFGHRTRDLKSETTQSENSARRNLMIQYGHSRRSHT